MAKEELRDRYVALLMDRFNSTRYPSAPMMNRLEASIRDQATAEEYLQALLDHLDEAEYPSPPMLDRVNRLIDQLG